MARTNLHLLATRLLNALDQGAVDGQFEGKLRQVATEAGLNSVRSAEAVKLLEGLGRIDVIQRGRRGRDTIIAVQSTAEVTLEEAESSARKAGGRARGRPQPGDRPPDQAERRREGTLSSGGELEPRVRLRSQGR